MSSAVPHPSRRNAAAPAARRSSLPLGLVVAGLLGLALQSTLPSCSLGLGDAIDVNRTCGAQLAQSVRHGADATDHALDSAACKGAAR